MGAGTCVRAKADADILVEYITKELRKTVVPIDGDGLCMLRGVAHVVAGDAANFHGILRGALQQLPVLLADGNTLLDDAAAKIVLAKSAKMLGCSSDAALVKQVRANWDSHLGDMLPAALSRSIGRPLYIIELVRGEPKTTVVATHDLPEAGQPMILMHSWVGLGVDHYDVVE
jgi:hypothetical protein